MKKVRILCLSVIVSLGFSSAVNAAIVDANETGWMRLDDGQSINCIAHYIPDITGVTDTLIFSAAPQFNDTPGYVGDYTGWQTVLSPDQKMVYMYGPLNTNDTGIDDVEWFSYTLFVQWDDENLQDPDRPVYIDAAYFDGDFGTASFGEWFARGEPGNPSSWIYNWESSHSGPYTNPAPVPEPTMIGLLAFGIPILSGLRRKPKA